MFPRVLAPNAALREQVIQSAGPSPALLERLKNAADLMGIKEESEEKYTVDVSAGTGIPKPSKEAEPPKRMGNSTRASYLWAMLIARIYEALPLLCPRCNHPMKIIAFITEPSPVSRILKHLGVPTEH